MRAYATMPVARTSKLHARLSPPPSAKGRAGRSAFTLVELMVVITVIVVLLALLSPALDRAVYQAELTVCGARLDAMGAAVISRAMEKKRRYPTRAAGPEPIRVTSVSTNDDDRPVLRDYLGTLKLLVCPLGGSVDFDLGRPPANNLTGDYCLTAYALWFGYGYTGERAMRKMGDRWTARTSSNVRNTFGLLAGDFCWTFFPNRVDAAHPDSDAVMYPRVLQNEATDDPLEPIGGSGVGYVLSYWWNTSRSDRGLLDLSFLHEDGGVTRYNDIEREINDARMVQVPPRNDNYGQWGPDSYLIAPRN